MQAPYLAVANAEDLKPGEFLKVAADGRAFVIAQVGEDVYAVEDLCSHEDYPLSYGCLDGERIKCSLHGSRFSLKTGAPEDEPADQPIATFAVAIEDEQIWLDPSRATNAQPGNA
ncbi:Rieske (2Fe-2S) protein [Rhabdochromatium marinum]|uniref:Rieske (2Fe-2S) protein n=1 Tax=Rhabdochromatium marinum TaxID=48729 RepID=UPI001904F3E7|nr:non-heme iron oxygenase ferredoxin subunit [Rhabdochromatium marinum]MBK1647344.1 (2Fe-2S)-binding protein [Rhabdochromatium marinum]